MLKKSDLRFKSIWQKWNGFLNVVFLSGFVENIRDKDDRIIFDLRQTGFISHGLKVVLDKGTYLPAAITEGAPVKLYTRVQQDIECDYSSLILRPIYCTRAGLNEIPSETQFLLKGKDSKYKTINPYISLDQLSDKPRQKQQSLIKKFQNNVEVAGFVRSKKRISDDCVAFDLWNQEDRILPVRIYGKGSILNHDALTLLRPIKLHGRVEVKEIMINDTPKKQIYIRAENIVFPLPGKELPSDAPQWYVNAIEELKNASTGVKSNNQGFNRILLNSPVEANPVIDDAELDKVDINHADIFVDDDSVIFDENIQDIAIIP